jgi:hypothetical protein
MRKRERGEGGVFRIAGSKNWYIKFKGRRVPTGTPIKEVAIGKLQERMGILSLGMRAPEDLRRLRYEDIREGLLSKYRIGMQSGRSLVKRDGKETIGGLQHLDKFFAVRRCIDIDTTLLQQFIKHRQGECAAPGTINRNLGILRRMFHQARRVDAAVVVPHPHAMQEPEPRQGFIEDPAFTRLFVALPERLRTFVLVLYTTGVRTGEAKKIHWSMVDLDARLVSLPGSITKNGKARTIPIVDLVAKRLKKVKPKDRHGLVPYRQLCKGVGVSLCKSEAGHADERQGER